MAERMININGNMVGESRSGVSVNNRGYKFGDALFESVRVANGKPLFTEDHYSRLMKGMQVLHFDTPVYWNQAFFKKELQKVITENDLLHGGRLRFTAFRKGEGLYYPTSNEFGFVVEGFAGETNQYLLNEKGLTLGIYDQIRLYNSPLSSVKTNNCLPYIMAAMDARSRGFDEVLLLNHAGMLAEATSSNVFLLLNGMLYTPSLEDGCVAGVMRKKVMQLARKNNLPVIETSISLHLLADAEEVFLTNAISGIRWVGSFEKKRYFHRVSEKLVTSLNELLK